jgi:hypothetical protein
VVTISAPGRSIRRSAAAILQDRKIPFVFTTGYDAATMVPERFTGRPIVSKPFSPDDITRALQAVLADNTGLRANGSVANSDRNGKPVNAAAAGDHPAWSSIWVLTNCAASASTEALLQTLIGTASWSTAPQRDQPPLSPSRVLMNCAAAASIQLPSSNANSTMRASPRISRVRLSIAA